ncbi:MAG: response regulator [Candidatus Eisenbacteria bacterium]|nr:response regulator [Candidatus Eisenbacteria bacterium]
MDDEESIRRITAAHLKRSGYEVVLASNGREGLETAKEVLPDLILLDLMMPEMDGYSVARSLRADFATSQIPIIILTAKFTLDDKMAGLEVGANDYITKPFAVAELLARIRTVLNWSKQQRSANPLTGLPGNVSIEEALEKKIQSGDPFAAVYVDLDNFKAYNDYYGYSQGDMAIREIAGALVRACRAEGDGSEFVGHIGGDDFIFFASPDRAETISRFVIEEFTNSLQKLIRPDDLKRGYIEVGGRTGDIKQFPLLSVTLAMVTSDRHQIEHVAQVGDIASEVKQYGKSIQGSVLVRDRRRENLPPVVAGGPEDVEKEGEAC